MLIKNYLADGTVRIVENVQDVRVHTMTYGYDSIEELRNPDFGPYTEDHLPRALIHHPDSYPDQAHPLVHEGRNRSANCKENCRFIDYIQGDSHACRMFVGAFAYVCNDEGKTIEKVVA